MSMTMASLSPVKAAAPRSELTEPLCMVAIGNCNAHQSFDQDLEIWHKRNK